LVEPVLNISEQIDAVRRQIERAAARASRNPADVKLVAVSKTFPAAAVRAAAAAGQFAFGENRVQEGAAKIVETADLSLEWHLIGHLQSNKAQRAAALFGWIDAVDSVELVRKLDSASVQLGKRLSVLVQVDLAFEATKHGVAEANLRTVVDAALESRALDLRGLMIVPPIPETAEDSRPWFRRLRELRDGLVAEGRPAHALADLSMGMSQDFEVAVEEGATLVRIGTAIFGGRAYPTP
jgi:hypothetical protein